MMKRTITFEVEIIVEWDDGDLLDGEEYAEQLAHDAIRKPSYLTDDELFEVEVYGITLETEQG